MPMDERQAIITNTMATTGKIFGTDGIRGRFDEGWLPPERVSALGRAVARADVNGAGRPARVLRSWRSCLPPNERKNERKSKRSTCFFVSFWYGSIGKVTLLQREFQF